MKTKNLMVSILAIVVGLFMVASVSAFETGIMTIDSIEVDGVDVTLVASEIEGKITYEHVVTLNAGDKVEVEVKFHSNVDARDVTVALEFGDAEAETSRFIMNADSVYTKTLTFVVPFDFDSDDVEYTDTLEITVEGEVDQEFDVDDVVIKNDGNDFEDTVDVEDITVLKPGYNAVIKSVNVPQSIDAGDNFPVEIVVINDGFNDLDDLYVTVSIPALDLTRSAYFGDLVDAFTDSDSHDDDDVDSTSGTLMLEVPYGVAAGVYTLEVTVENDDTTTSVAKQIAIGNDFEANVFVSGNDLWIVNPTDNVIGYRVVPESPASVSDNIVFVPAGASATVTVTPNAEGEYSFDVNVFTMTGELVQTVSFSGAEGSDDSSSSVTNPVVVLTVILAIIFLVLLIVLIVLIGKKPEKTEEFGESYY